MYVSESIERKPPIRVPFTICIESGSWLEIQMTSVLFGDAELNRFFLSKFLALIPGTSGTKRLIPLE